MRYRITAGISCNVTVPECVFNVKKGRGGVEKNLSIMKLLLFCMLGNFDTTFYCYRSLCWKWGLSL